jgi:hypothetical protein
MVNENSKLAALITLYKASDFILPGADTIHVYSHKQMLH